MSVRGGRFSGWALLALFWISSVAHAHECSRYFHTLLGPYGVRTFSLDSRGNFQTWRDWIRSEGPQFFPHFEVEGRAVRPSDFGSLKAFSVMPSIGGRGDLGLVSEADGAMSFILPNGRAVPIHAPQLEDLSASTLVPASLYRIYRRVLLADVGLIAVNSDNHTEQKVIRELVEDNYLAAGASAYFAAKQAVYKLRVEHYDLTPQDEEDFGARLVHGPVEIHDSTSMAQSTAIVPSPIIDLSPRATRRETLLATNRAGTAFRIRALDKVFEPRTEDLHGIDFIKVVGENTLVLGSELGQILITHLGEKEPLYSLTLDRPGWISDIAAHRFDNRYVVWAINQSDHQLYRWQSDDISRQLRPFAEQLPPGVHPVSLASLGLGIPSGYFEQKQQYGLFSQFIFRNPVAEIERTLVSASDGNLYGWTQTSADQADLHWVTHPFAEWREEVAPDDE